VPARVTNRDRSNSGVFLMGRCEVQVLDSCTDDDYATNKTYTDGQGNCMRKARIPVFQNGVCVRNNLEIKGAGAHGTKARYSIHGDGPIVLRDHGNPIPYGNIGFRKLPEEPYLVE
jgi:hypothetical protein